MVIGGGSLKESSLWGVIMGLLPHGYEGRRFVCEFYSWLCSAAGIRSQAMLLVHAGFPKHANCGGMTMQT